jgi:lysophospholipase L1-like esterase
MRRTSIAWIIGLSLFIMNCGGTTMESGSGVRNPLDNVSAEALAKLADKRIYFGHQSVGYNILDGVKDVIREDPRVRLNIIETADPAVFDSPVLGHSRIGKNMDPVSKYEAFKGYLDNGIGKKTDIAFMKLCYLDVSAETDVAVIFKQYKQVMKYLQEAYPGTVFVHITAPLLSTDTGIKGRVKRWIGRNDATEYANYNRNRFNDLLEEYRGREPIFDLARIESTMPDKRRQVFTYKGNRYYTMNPAYTTDGGHLNAEGRKVVARELLALLATLSR